MKKFLILLMVGVVLGCAQKPKKEAKSTKATAKTEAPKPQISEELDIDEPTRLALFDKFIAELERIDGEGLLARRNRPEAWRKTIQKLKIDLRNAKTKYDFGQVFRRLDATYPNLHAHLSLDPHYDISANKNRPVLAARFAPEIVNRGQGIYRYFVSKVETDLVSNLKEARRPGLGDEVLEINGKPLRDWSKQNLIFCKYPLREQCEANIYDHFRKELLGWDRTMPLTFKLKRNNREWTIDIPFRVAKSNTEDSGDYCFGAKEQYHDFEVVLKGTNICVYESPKWPGTAVLRIGSFRYRNQAGDIRKEVNNFYDNYWKAKSGSTKKLIIDLIDNGGGDTPIAWYEALLKKPFQEAYVQFKKIPELDIDEIRKHMFYEDSAREIWFNNLKSKGVYAKIPNGGFLPHHPQFCADATKNCSEGLFTPRGNEFAGQVRILTNEYCVSTCTGFVWMLKNRFLSRIKVIGFPESGDSAFARVYLDIVKKDGTYQVVVNGRAGQTSQELPNGALLRQQVTATRSTDMNGNIISAKPVMPDVWIPYRYFEPGESWEFLVFQEALKN